MLESTTSFFQGDLGFLKLPENLELPNGYRKLKPEAKGLVLAYGEASGHAHAFKETTHVDVYYVPSNDNDQRGYDEMYIKVKKPTVLVHEEHDSILFLSGIYKKWLQKEYTFESEYRVVAD